MFNILLILIFLRPFISSLLFPALDMAYSLAFLIFSVFWPSSKKIAFGDNFQTRFSVVSPFLNRFRKGLSFRIRKVFYTFLYHKKRPSLKYSPLHYPILFFFLSVLLSCFLSTGLKNSFQNLHKYLAYLAGFYLASQTAEKEKHNLIFTLFLSAAVVGLIGLYQYIFGFQGILDLLAKIRPVGFNFAKKYLEQKRIFSVFVTPTVFAGYLILIIPLILGYLYDKKQKILKRPLSYLLILLGICLFLTKSIGAFISLFLTIGLFLILSGAIDKKTLLLTLILFSATLTLLIILRNYLRPETLPALPISTIQRQMYWKDTWEMIKMHPFRGTGLGNFSISGTKFSHNSYLQIWAEMGILAFIAYLWLVFSFLRTGFLRLKMLKLRGFSGEGILSGIIASITGFLLHNLVDFTFFIPEVALLWWILLGLG